MNISYQQFRNTKLEIRDYLALERTILANERTLLSYLRTGLAITVAGISGYNLLEGTLGSLLGGLVTFVGFSLCTFGILRFRSVKRRLDLASPGETADQTAEEVSRQQADG